MTSFKVFQIHLSYLQYTILAEGKFPVPKEQWRKRIQLAMDEDAQSIDKYVSHALEEGFYDHVADIEATDLHDVFRVGNVGPEELITRQPIVTEWSPMHSISVGDVIEDTDGVRHVVLPRGFAPVAFDREAA
tara:strand:+ start:26 stop:421 length:396 start_codon:yes stop_codon:yes gene_type:complete